MSIMDDDNGVSNLVERIIKEFNETLEDHELSEFDIVPVESTTNKSPVLLVESSLGLESWCVKHVYNYCYAELIRYLKNTSNRRSPTLKRIYYLLNPTILINPDVTTFWNKRREITLMQFDSWFGELNFSKLVLSRKPKCNEAYAYRRWILNLLLERDDEVTADFLELLISEELRVCNMAADKVQNNYHCWDHRAFVVDILWRYKGIYNSTEFYFNEYKFIRQWTSTHVSDYSCFHYLQICINILFAINEKWSVFEKMMKVQLRKNFQKFIADRMKNDGVVTPSMVSSETIQDDELMVLVLGYTPGNCKCYATWDDIYRKLLILFYELVINEELLKYYKNHTTIWYHRRFIVHHIFLNMYQYLEVENRCNGFVRPKPRPPAVIERKNSCKKCANADLTEHHINAKKQQDNNSWFWKCPLYKALIRNERALVKQGMLDDPNCTESYYTYLRFIESLFFHFNL